MIRAHIIAILCIVLAAVALGYFGFVFLRSDVFARVLLRRGYEKRGWTEDRLALRIKMLGVAGALVALAAILLALSTFR